MIECALTFAGVVLPSLAITFAVRRWLERVPWRIAFLLLALALLFVSRGVFTSAMPVPLDEVVRGYPYRGLVGEVQSKNDLTNDTVKQILPWMQTVREEFAHGRAPLWNPYLFCGYPLLGNGQSAPFAPLFLATLFVPLPKQLVAMAGAKLFVALLFGFLFIKREGTSDAAAVFGSSVFAFAIFNNCFLYYPMTAVTLLLPAAAYATTLTLRERRVAPMVLLAVVVASLLAGGHPESVVHVAMCCVALLLIERGAKRRDWARVTFAAVCGLLIAAPAWLPVLEQVMVSLRVKLLAPGEAMGDTGVFPVKVLWAMLNPDAYGHPAHHNWSWFMTYTHVASVYLGLIVIALLPCALVAEKRDRWLLAIAGGFFVISMNWTPLTQLAHWVAHDRLRFVVEFLAGVLVARAVTAFGAAKMRFAAVASAVLLPLAIYVFMKGFDRTLMDWRSIAGVAALVIFWVATWMAPRRAALFACVLTVAELFVFTLDYNAMTDRRFFVPRLPIIDELKRVAPAEPYRVLGLDWVLLPNAAEQYRLEDVRGSDPMEWNEYARFFKAAEVPDASIDVKRIADPEQPLVDFLNVRFLLTEPRVKLGGKWRPIYSGIDGELYENSAVQPRFFGPAGVSLFAREDRPGRYTLRISSPARALIGSSQPAMRGWRARVNGHPVGITRIRDVFMGFFVDSGESKVIVVYRPASWTWSLGMAVFGAVALAVGSRRKWWNRPSEGRVVQRPDTGLAL
jgi:hypothetical protein